MKWKQFWEQLGTESNALDQVGRKGGLVHQPESFLKEYAAYTATQLQLKSTDVLLDVCCGNGLLTQYLSQYCKSVIGVDFSQTHIDYANEHYATDQLQFICADALQLDQFKLNGTITKASLCFSFQYFETVQAGLQVVQGMMHQGAQQILLTDIPDRSKFFTYYHSLPKLLRLIKQHLQQQNDMGKFWSEEELNWIAKQMNAAGTKITQPSSFPYAHYRMDYLMSK